MKQVYSKSNIIKKSKIFFILILFFTYSQINYAQNTDEKKANPQITVESKKIEEKNNQNNSANNKATEKDEKVITENKKAKAVYALMDIKWGPKGKNKSHLKIKLYHLEAPITVKNFTDLAEGRKEVKIRKKSHTLSKPFYNGLKFHRIVRGFMIQGGDPRGTGRGGPGYKFEDEFHSSLNHGRAGMLSMANSGKNTNGSQFFITVSKQSHLDNLHSVFGKVIEGLEEVIKISKVRTDRFDKPKNPVIIEKVTIVRE